jgi:glycosyltransferase involved in cell wall biosynthesis
MASGDARIRLFRNERNIGAAGNYNRVFSLARGEYFKWAAHDDVLAPTFIERTVEVLDTQPDVSVCTSRTRRIDESDAVTGSYPADGAWDCQAASARFHSLVFTAHACVAVFGLVRREVLARTPLIGPYVNSDRVLLAELGLWGRIHEIPEELFFRRDHPGSSLRTFPDTRQRVRWFDPSRSASFSFPEWSALMGYMSAVRRAPLTAAEKSRCFRTVGALALSQWRPLLADFKYAALGLLRRTSA